MATAVVACALLDWRQIAVWHDSITLWRHVLANTPRSALARMGRMREAVERFEKAATLAPGDPEVRVNLLRARAALRRDQPP